MPARPQFSLRMLMFVVVMVCLVAGTVTDLPGGQQTVLLEIALNVQTLLRAALCVAFPAMLTTGAIFSRGLRRAFFLGGLFPAATALLVVCLGIAREWSVTSYDFPRLLTFWRMAPQQAFFLAGLWAFVPICGLCCVFIQQLLQRGDVDKNHRDASAE